MAEHHDVGADRGRVDIAVCPAQRHPFGQPGGAGMILVESIDHVPQGDQAGSGQHSRLAHPASETLASVSGLLHHVELARQDRAHWRAQTPWTGSTPPWWRLRESAAGTPWPLRR